MYDKISDRKIIIYGAGYVGKILANYLLYCKQCEVVAFVVSDGHREFLEYTISSQLMDKTLPILEVSELPKNLSDYVFLVTAIAGMQEVVDTLVKLGVKQENIMSALDKFVDIEDAFCREYCEAYGIALDLHTMQFNDVKIYNVLLDDPILHKTFWGTFGDELMPLIYGDVSLTVDGPYEDDETGVTVAEGDFILDVGANLGLYSCYAANKGCFVYACDPDSRCIRVLEEQKKLYADKIAIIPYGLSDHVGEESFYESDDCGISSMCLVRGQTTEKKIQLETIDHLVEIGKIQHIDYIKADIEGAERYMLRGAKNVLKTMAPKLSICTYHYKDDPQVLEEIIMQANPNYVVTHKWRKLYAYVPKEAKV